MKNKLKKAFYILNFTFLIFLILSCTKPEPTNPFDPQVNWAPTNLKYEILSGTSIELSWLDNCNLEDGFIIERKENNNWIQLAQLGANVTHYIDDSFIITDMIYYRMYAFAEDNNSAYSNEINISLLLPGTIFVQGGTFNMGDHYNEGGSDELPVHLVTLDDFFIGVCEITHTQYIEFLNDFGVSSNGSYNGTELIDMDDSDCAIDYNGSFYFGGSSYASFTECPVIEVTWYGGAVYCNWRSQQEGLTECYNLSDWSCDFNADGYRLPTEAEWEYAARGGVNWTDDYRYSGCHNVSDLPNYAWISSNSNSQTHPVGTKLPNQLEIHDMSGNVWEWCNDWYDISYYSSSPANNPTGPPTGTYRVLRGGSWYYNDFYCRVANRVNGNPNYSYYNLGFRITRTP